jgi:hypothetical protein
LIILAVPVGKAFQEGGVVSRINARPNAFSGLRGQNVPLSDLQRATVDIRLNRADVEDRDGDLGVRGLRSELEVGVTHRLANGIHTNEGTSREEVLALEGPSAHRVLLSPDAVRVLREELCGSELVTGVAASRGLSVTELCRALVGHYITASDIGVRVCRLLRNIASILVVLETLVCRGSSRPRRGRPRRGIKSRHSNSHRCHHRDTT